MADLDQYKDFRTDVVTSALAVLAILGVGYVGYFQPLKSDIKTIGKASSSINKKIGEMNIKLKESKKEGEIKSATIKTIPDFLIRINEIAKKNEVYLDTVQPVEGNQFQYDISFSAKYHIFIRFLFGLEKLNVNIDDVSLNPFKGPNDNPTQAINFRITLIGEGEQLKGKEIAALEKKVTTEGKRNPFQMLVKLKGKEAGIINLTYVWKLSAFGKGPPPFVYINGSRYSTGQKIGKKKITGIFLGSHVELEARTVNGMQKYILKTRTKAKKRRR